MSAVTRLCPRVVLLDQGRVLADGAAGGVVNSYLSSGLGITAVREWPDSTSAPGNDVVRLRAVRVHTEDCPAADAVDIRRAIGIQVTYDVLEAGAVLAPNVHLFNEEGVCLFVSIDVSKQSSLPKQPGTYVSNVWIPGNLLAEGTFLVRVMISTLNPPAGHVDERDTVAFHVVDTQDGDSARGEYTGFIPGVVRPVLDWTTRPLSAHHANGDNGAAVTVPHGAAVRPRVAVDDIARARQ
jgi:lipopolysaccharide transport system ATP-binding protein